MRNTNLYQVFDTVGQNVMGPIITAHHHAGAVRIFTDALRDPKTSLGVHPEDFELRHLGYQDEETAAIDPLNTPHVILTGSQWIMSQQQAPQLEG